MLHTGKGVTTYAYLAHLFAMCRNVDGFRHPLPNMFALTGIMYCIALAGNKEKIYLGAESLLFSNAQ